MGSVHPQQHKSLQGRHAESAPHALEGRSPLRGVGGIGYEAPSGGVRDVRLHDLRHSYASTALQHGETVLTIGRLLGHGHPATILKYTHSADATVREAVEAVGAVLEG